MCVSRPGAFRCTVSNSHSSQPLWLFHFVTALSSLHDHLKRSQVLAIQTWNCRKSNETRFILKVVEFGAQKCNRAAGRRFGVGESLVRAWRKEQVEAVVSEKDRL